MKKALIYLLTITILLFTLTPCSLVNADSCDDLSIVYERIENSFPLSEDGSRIYSDEYGGAFINDNTLCIYLTSTTSINMNKYRNLAKCDNLKFLKADYSLYYLNGLYKEVSTYTDKYNISFFTVDIARNRFLIGIAPPNEKDTRRLHTSTLNLSYEDTVNELFMVLSNSAYIFEPADYIDFYTFRGGDGLVTKDEDGNAMSSSICACGTYNNSPALLIAGHAVRGVMSTGVTWERWTDAYYNGAYIGNCVLSQYSNNGLGDYAIIALSGTYGAQMSNDIWKTTSATLDITSTGSSVVGNTVYCYGNTTRIQTQCQVIETNVSFNCFSSSSSITLILTGMVRARIDRGSASNEDSGGPVYKLASSTSTTATLVGGISAGYSSGVYSYLIYSPVYYAENCNYPNGGFVEKTS